MGKKKKKKKASSTGEKKETTLKQLTSPHLIGGQEGSGKGRGKARLMVKSNRPDGKALQEEKSQVREEKGVSGGKEKRDPKGCRLN